jgi:hypothetical protein
MLDVKNQKTTSVFSVMKITKFVVKSVSLIFSLSIAAVMGAILRMKPASARNFYSVFPLQLTLSVS